MRINPKHFFEWAQQKPELWALLRNQKLDHDNWGVCEILAVKGKNDGFYATVQHQDRKSMSFSRHYLVDNIDLESFNEGKIQNLYISDSVYTKISIIRETRGFNSDPQKTSKDVHTEGLSSSECMRKSNSVLSPEFVDNNADINDPHINDQQREKVQIQDYCTKHKVDYLFHFTRFENLDNILQHGLLSRKALKEKLSESFLVNDRLRYDSHPEAICLSIGFPNYKMFYKLRNNNRENWLVLVLSSKILWELDCAFCTENAASNKITRIPVWQRKSFDAFLNLFKDTETKIRAELNIPDCFPTNPQAEVLVFDRIPVQYINKIHSDDYHVFLEIANRYPEMKPMMVKSDKYYKPRCDYLHWQK